MKLSVNLKKRNKILAGLVLVPVLLWGYYNLFYLPHLKNIRILKKEIVNLEAIVKTMKEAGVTTVDSATDNFKLRLRQKEFYNIKERLNKMEGRLLEKKALSTFLSDLTGLANQCKIEVTFFAPHPEKEVSKESFYHSLPLELNIRTSWADLINFLQKLQGLPGLASVQNIELKVDKEKIPCLEGKLILELWLRN